LQKEGIGMSQYDYIKDIARYALSNDKGRLMDSLHGLVDYSEKTKKFNFAAQLQSIISEGLRRNQIRRLRDFSEEDENNENLIISSVMSSYNLDDIICSDDVKNDLRYFIKEHKQSSDLKELDIPLSNKLLFYGPSGCGKTLAASIVAGELEKPLITMNLGAIVSSKLGETSKNLTKVFKQGAFENAIIFLDEFDSIGKIRDYDQDHGEMKRVVNTLLQLFDYLNDNSIVIAATNQVQMIDEALRRRFDLLLELKLPDENQIIQLIDKTLGKKFYFRSDDDKQRFVKAAKGYSYYEVQKALILTIKRMVLDHGMTHRDIDIDILLSIIKKERPV
jgi:AAA+ superfamily predicted ATPase